MIFAKIKKSEVVTENLESESAVEITDVRLTFNEKDFVLDGVSFKIPNGAITVIIGSSGTGKSVLLKVLLGLIRPTSGSIKVFGQEMTKMDNKQLLKMRQHCGMLFQDSALFDDMTALNNVVFPLTEHRRELTKEQKNVIARAKLKDAGLEEVHFDKLPSDMSGGMRKRVALARALALDPKIMIYDEPTSSLDPVLTGLVDELIMKTEKLKAGTTSIVVSHDMYGAFQMADHIAMLEKGKLLLFGTPDDFLKSEDPTVKNFVSEGLHRIPATKKGRVASGVKRNIPIEPRPAPPM